MRTNFRDTTLALLHSWITLTDEDREALARRDVVARGVEASGQQISVVAACATDASADEFLAHVRALGYVKRDRLIGRRFGELPALEDLAELTLDQGDIDRLGQCQRGDCALNLSEQEMSALQSALGGAAATGSDVQDAFRRMVLERVRRYRSHGMSALPAYDDRERSMQPALVFSELLQHTAALRVHIPALAEYLQQFPRAQTAGMSSFFHWSKVIMNGKPVLLVAHLTTLRPPGGPGVPTVVLAAKQIYASRYMNGELALWMLFAGDGQVPNYLVYLHRSHLDALGGTLNALRRTVLERGIKQEVAETIATLRDQLERRR